MEGLRRLFYGDGEDFPASLNSEERRYGRLLFRRFFMLNGISVATLMGNLLVLYAIRNGLSDAMTAVMASLIFLTMPSMMLVKPVVSRLGAARARGLGWFARYVSASIMLLGPVLGRFAPQSAVTAVIMTGAFGFAFFRAVGIGADTPLAGEITEPDGRGRFFSINFILNQSAYLVSMALILLAFRYSDALWVYQVVIGVGCAVGLYASTIIARVPESAVPRTSAMKPFREMIRRAWENYDSRRMLYAWCAGMASHVVVVPFMMIALKNGYGVSDFTALFFALLLAFGGVSSGFINKKISDSTGARKLLILYILGLMAIAFFWSFAPEEFISSLVAAAFICAGFCKTGILIGLNQYFLGLVPGSDRVGSSMIMRISSGATAGLAGSVFGGGLLRLLALSGFERFDVYRNYFLVILAVLAAFLLVVKNLKDDRNPA